MIEIQGIEELDYNDEGNEEIIITPNSNNSNATKVTYLAKIKTSVQLFTILFYLIALALNKMLLIVIGDIFLIVTALITIYTGYIYTIATFKK